MADLESSFRTATLLGTGIAAAFSNRFYWNHVPDAVTYPIIKAQTVTDNANDTHSSKWGGRANIQLDVYDDDKSGCNANAALVRSWLHNYKGVMGDYRVMIKVRNFPSTYEDEARLYRRMLEVEILYFE